jgi:hypothetical protein
MINNNERPIAPPRRRKRSESFNRLIKRGLKIDN